MHPLHSFPSETNTCMPTKRSDLTTNLVVIKLGAPHTKSIIGETVTNGFHSACVSVSFCRRRCRWPTYKRNTSHTKYHEILVVVSDWLKKGSKTVRTTWFPSASESDFCAIVAQICHRHTAFFLSSGLNRNHQTINGFCQKEILVELVSCFEWSSDLIVVFSQKHE